MTGMIRQRLADVLTGLQDDQYVVVVEPAPPAPRRSGLARLLPWAAPQGRFVQVVRSQGEMLAEAVGDRSFGGGHDHGPDVDKALRDLGWLAPDDADYEPIGGPLYRRWLPTSDTQGAADLLLFTLGTMGVDTGSVELETGP